MSRPTVSFSKRQREQSKREKKAEKAAKRAQRKITKEAGGTDDEVLNEMPADENETEPVHASAE